MQLPQLLELVDYDPDIMWRVFLLFSNFSQFSLGCSHADSLIRIIFVSSTPYIGATLAAQITPLTGSQPTSTKPCSKVGKLR